MFLKLRGSLLKPVLTSLVIYLTICFSLAEANPVPVQGLPSSTIDWFARYNKLQEKSGSGLDGADKSFQQFVSSKPDESIVIGHLKPNASELELLMLKRKINDAIIGIKELEKKSHSATSSEQAECYIEVTKMNQVERLPGKCGKVGGGLPICQSEHYMTFSSDCS